MHLSEYMAWKKFSDEDVAAALGCTRETVSRYRRRKLRPDWELAGRITEWSKGAVPLESWLDATEAAE